MRDFVQISRRMTKFEIHQGALTLNQCEGSFTVDNHDPKRYQEVQIPA